MPPPLLYPLEPLMSAAESFSQAQCFAALGLADVNAGTWAGSRGWSNEPGTLFDAVNPSTGQRLAQVRAATAVDYEHVLADAVVAAQAWREVPAPKRGEGRAAHGRGTARAQVGPRESRFAGKRQDQGRG